MPDLSIPSAPNFLSQLPPHDFREFCLYFCFDGWIENFPFQFYAGLTLAQVITICLAEPHRKNIFTQ